MKIKKADFVKSAVYEKDYPEQLDKMEFNDSIFYYIKIID